MNGFAELAARFDGSDMARVIRGFPNQIERALETPLPPLPARKFDRMVIAGMGGSALPSEVLLDAFGARITAPVTVCRSYRLEGEVGAGTFVIASSFSGETEETIEAAASLLKTGATVAVVTKGGRLAELGRTSGCPVILIPVEHEPPGFQPRSAVGYFLTFFARLFSAAGALEDVTAELRGAAGKLRELDLSAPAQSIATWLGKRIPVVYTDEIHMMSVARIAKIKFNENSKRPAFFNALPEANHNEMIGFVTPSAEFGILYLNDPDSHPGIPRRFHVMKSVFEKEGLNNVSFAEWSVPGGSRLEKVLSALVFCDWCSYYVALLSGVDPTPVGLVEKFKKALAESVSSGAA